MFNGYALTLRHAFRQPFGLKMHFDGCHFEFFVIFPMKIQIFLIKIQNSTPTALTLFLRALARGNIEMPPKTGSKNDMPETKYFGVAAVESKNGHF